MQRFLPINFLNLPPLLHYAADKPRKIEQVKIVNRKVNSISKRNFKGVSNIELSLVSIQQSNSTAMSIPSSTDMSWQRQLNEHFTKGSGRSAIIDILNREERR